MPTERRRNRRNQPNESSVEVAETEAVLDTEESSDLEVEGTQTENNEVLNESNVVELAPKEKSVAKPVTLKVTRSVTSLETMEDIELAKHIEFINVETEQEAIARLGNDREKFLEVINEGLMSLEKTKAKEDDDGWRTLDDKGNLNGPFEGLMADAKKVGAMILTFARFNGYSDKANQGNSKKRKAIRDAATELVKNMIKGSDDLKKQVAFTKGDSDVVGEGAETEETETVQ